MAPRNWYDDPFGPSKKQRPMSEEQRERERQQHILRGCGDPGCAVCNPETAARGMTGSPNPNSRYGSSSPSVSGYVRTEEDYERQRYEELKRQAIQYVYDPNWNDIPYSTPATPKKPAEPVPSAAYKAAREEVEKYIVPAPVQGFDDIVGNEEALSLLKDAIRAPVEHKALYEAYNMKMPKGALLSGPPGCGKTMFARAAASEMKKLYGEALEFISISGSELQSMYVGETEERIKSIFTFAREYKAFHKHPLLVFMDEAEVLLPDRTGRVRRVAPWEESQVATFLAEMDGMQESGAFVLLATNRPEVIDQAVLRDGRCDFKITVKRPTMEALEIIIRKNFEGVLLEKDAEPESLVFTALECFQDPHKVLLEAHLLGIDFEHEKIDIHDKHFLFEHILSGAMAASIPARAKRYAFARDKLDGKARGVTASDVVKAVNDLFEENRTLDHSFALEEFRKVFTQEVIEARKSAEKKLK